MTDLALEPLVAPGLWLAAALASLMALAWHAWPRPSGTTRARWTAILSLQSLGVVGLLALLLNPTRPRPHPSPPDRPRLTLLLDDSASMATSDSTTGGTRRFDAARADAHAIAARFADRFTIATRLVSDPHRIETPDAIAATQPAGDRTDLADALNPLLALSHHAGDAVVLLSDGIDNHGSAPVLEAARSAAALDVPVYTRTYGDDTQRPDLSLELRSMQDVVLVHQNVEIIGTARYRGTRPAQTLAHLTRDDGVEIASVPLQLRAGGDDATVRFAVAADQVGMHRYSVALDALTPDGEATLDNNRSPYVLRVVDEPLRAMLLEGQPYWDAAFLTRTLASDPAIALDAYVRVRPDRTLRRTISHADAGATTRRADAADRIESNDVLGDPSAILSSAADLSNYSVVVVGRDAESFLTPTALDSLRHWIAAEGGALVCYRGEPTSSAVDGLAALLPVQWTGSDNGSRGRLSLTDAGSRQGWTFSHDAIGSELPALPGDSRVTTDGRPLAVVLATITDAAGIARPAITMQPYGAGRVVVIEGAGMWRWSFLSPAYRDRQPAYAALWQSLLRWLATDASRLPGARRTLRADKTVFDADEPATATIFDRSATTTQPAAAVVRLHALDAPHARDQQATAVPLANAPGLASVSFGPLPPGRYTAQIDGASPDDPAATVAFDVRRFGRELLDLQPRPDLMRRIATVTGSVALEGDAAEFTNALERALADHRTAAFETNDERVPAWDRPAIMAAIVAAWAAAWVLRRRGGLT